MIDACLFWSMLWRPNAFSAIVSLSLVSRLINTGTDWAKLWSAPWNHCKRCESLTCIGWANPWSIVKAKILIATFWISAYLDSADSRIFCKYLWTMAEFTLGTWRALANRRWLGASRTTAYPDSAKFEVFPINLVMSMFPSSAEPSAKCHIQISFRILLTQLFSISVRFVIRPNFFLVSRQAFV